MAILLCGKCGYLREVKSQYTGKSVICPECKQANPVQDTIELLKNVIRGYRQQSRELKQMRERTASPERLARPEPPASVEAESKASVDRRRRLIAGRIVQLTGAEAESEASVDRRLLADVDIHNTTTLADPQQYAPIVAWMEKRRIRLDIDHQAIDTTGFFDEVAVRMGDHYDTLKPVADRLKYSHQRGFANVKISLSNSSPEQVETITSFCRELHDYSFVSKHFHNRKERTIHMVLQQAPAIVRFFIGEWMEWFVFMKILNSFREHGIPVACLRGFHVDFPNGDRHEIDGFFLVGNGVPLCIECKSGEFRQDIKKFSLVRKKLNLDRTGYLVCAIGLTDAQINGFNSMYDVTFANESNFLQHVRRLVQ